MDKWSYIGLRYKNPKLEILIDEQVRSTENQNKIIIRFNFSIKLLLLLNKKSTLFVNKFAFLKHGIHVALTFFG